MAYSYVRYTGNGTTTDYTFPFNYLSQDHVKVRINGTLTPGYTFLNASTIKFDVAPASGVTIDIRRETPKDTPIVNFTDGSVLLERDLDLLATFDLYMAQESADAAEGSMVVDSTGRWNAQNKRIGNLAAPLADDEAVNKGTLDYEYPAVAVTAANNAAINIVASDLGVPAGTITDLGSITDPVSPSTPSTASKIVTVADNITDVQLVADNITAIQGASGSASAAAASATSAATSATNAASSATSASSSAASALSSKNSAETAAITATTKANDAAASALTATSQASAASGSASAAATSASNAATSAVGAASSATNASTSATNAASSANSAASSAASASASAATATAKASDASTSASNAASSATAAAGSATSALSSASAASTSATNAANSATAAANSATSASGSATSASTSATNAASSATAAAASASDAAASAASAAALLDNFDDRYLGPKSSAPTVDNDGNPLLIGALYFDTTSGKMRVYTASGWVDASSASQAALTVYRYTATSGQTTFSGADSSGLVLAYLAGGLVVSLNGVVLVGNGVDYTATNGSTVVLGSGATAGDILEVYAFSSFSVASVNGSAIVDSSITAAKLVDTYLTTSAAASGYQPLDGDLTSIAGLSGTAGLLKKTAANTWSLDTSTYLTSYTETDPVYSASPAAGITGTNITNWNTAYGWGNHASAGYLTTSTAASTYQPLDGDLTSIAGLAGTSGFLKKTAANTWSLDTNTYLTAEADTLATVTGRGATTSTAVTFSGGATVGGTGVVYNGSTSGSTTLKAAAAAGTTTITMPASTGTMALTSDIPTVNNGTLTLSMGAAAATNNTVTVGTGTGFSANTATNATYSLSVGPALTNLASTMTGATTGFLKKTGADTYTIDTTAYTANTGTVTSASVVSANGFAGTVATATTTPAITLSTTVSGVLKGNGTAISAATAGTDYVSPTGTETLTNKTLTNPVINGFTGDTSAINIGSGQIVKDTAGNLGLGVTPRSGWNSGFKAFELSGGYGAISGQTSGAAVVGFSWGVYATGAGTWAYSTTGDVPNLFTMNSGLYKWYTAPSGTAGNSVTFTEALRIDTSSNIQVLAGGLVKYAPAPAAISAAATLTNANIQAQIINTTGTSYTVTMPLGSTLETLVPWATTNTGYDFTVINTASGTITFAVNTGVTSLGTLTVATGVSANFRIRRTAANTFVLYRIS